MLQSSETCWENQLYEKFKKESEQPHKQEIENFLKNSLSGNMHFSPSNSPLLFNDKPTRSFLMEMGSEKILKWQRNISLQTVVERIRPAWKQDRKTTPQVNPSEYRDVGHSLLTLVCGDSLDSAKFCNSQATICVNLPRRKGARHHPAQPGSSGCVSSKRVLLGDHIHPWVHFWIPM